MKKLSDSFDDIRRLLPDINITDDMHRQRLLFEVAILQECFITSACSLSTLREVKRERLWAVSKFGAGRSPTRPVVPDITGLTATPTAKPLVCEGSEHSCSTSSLKGNKLWQIVTCIEQNHHIPKAPLPEGPSLVQSSPLASHAPAPLAWMTCSSVRTKVVRAAITQTRNVLLPSIPLLLRSTKYPTLLMWQPTMAMRTC